jgi:hypothetical protein
MKQQNKKDFRNCRITPMTVSTMSNVASCFADKQKHYMQNWVPCKDQLLLLKCGTNSQYKSINRSLSSHYSLYLNLHIVKQGAAL